LSILLFSVPGPTQGLPIENENVDSDDEPLPLLEAESDSGGEQPIVESSSDEDDSDDDELTVFSHFMSRFGYGRAAEPLEIPGPLF
jgi:hypothetical protein